MTIHCRRVLKGLRLLAGSTDERIGFTSRKGCVYLCSYPEKEYYCQQYENEFKAILNELDRLGYIQFESDRWHFTVTYMGMHPYCVKWEDVKSFLFTSVLVPIAVSAITALITLFINGILM